MDAVRTFHFTLFLVLLCCRYGVSYRIYILPEPGAFCLGVFSGDDCITWSEYSAHPKFADHSTTLIFTPGVYNNRYSYSYRTFTLANVKRFTMTGNGAQLQFPLTFSNVGEVRMLNLTISITNNPTISVQNVQSFVMENCTLSQAYRYSYYQPVGINMYISSSNLSRIVNSTFAKVTIDVRSYSTLLVETSTFMNSSQIKGDTYSSVNIYTSRFINNYANSYGVVYTQGPLEIIDCLFDSNSVSGGAVVYSMEDVTIRNSTFIRNSASYLSYYYRYRPYTRYYYTRFYQGGSAIRGQRNINIYNCTFSLYMQTSSIVYSYSYCYSRYHYYGYDCQEGLYEVYIADSEFYDSSRSIYSYNNVTIVDSSFYNITAPSGGGGVVYSTKSVAITNCMFINSTAVYGNGGVIYSQQWISIVDSVLTDATATGGSGGALYSQQDEINITSCTISDSIATYDGGAVYAKSTVTIANSSIVDSESKSGSGGAIYTNDDCTAINSEFRHNMANNGNGGGIYSGNDVKAINCNFSECSAPNGIGGAIYSAARDSSAILEPNIVLSKSTFSENSAECGGVLYTSGHYNHHMEYTDSTFIFNEATGTNTTNITGGGVGCVGNTTLSIKDSVFKYNEAETGGVLDLSFSTVTIEHSSFSQNSADDNGGVFHWQEYSTNFTIAHTIMDLNSARNGGVFYARRSNSNIKIINGKLIRNSASSHGGVMDIRGVTLTMDMDTVITNNTAGSSGDVISACVSQITAYGLEARLDPVYPLYCSIYDEGNGFRPHPMSQTISTDDSTAVSTTEQNVIGTTGHERDTESITTTVTVSEGGTTEMATTTGSASTAATFTSDSPGILHTDSPYEATTSSLSDTTSQLPSHNDATTAKSNTRSPTMMVSTETQSYTDEVTTISVDVTTSANVNQTTSSGSTSHDGHEGSTAMPTEFDITIATTITTSETDSPKYFSGSTVTTDSSSTDPDRFAVLQAEQEKYNDMWKNNQQNLLQVSIISLMVLCIVCTTVCVMMATLFFVACKRRKGLRLVPQGRYKKLSPIIDRDLEETKHENEMEEYSFSEI